MLWCIGTQASLLGTPPQDQAKLKPGGASSLFARVVVKFPVLRHGHLPVSPLWAPWICSSVKTAVTQEYSFRNKFFNFIDSKTLVWWASIVKKWQSLIWAHVYPHRYI